MIVVLHGHIPFRKRGKGSGRGGWNLVISGARGIAISAT